MTKPSAFNFVARLLPAFGLLLLVNCSSPSSPSSTTYTVTYVDDSGHDSGSLPVDSKQYSQNDSVTVLGNVNNLAKAGYTFMNWSSAANGGGTVYAASATFQMGSANVTLHAHWASSAKLILTFGIVSPAASGVIAGTAISVQVPIFTPVGGLKATFTTSPGAVVKVNGTVQVSGSTSNSFSSPVHYLVTAEDGSQVTYTVTVTPASPSCSDTMMDGTETDVDCGGTSCSPCANGKHCVSNSDCASSNCSSASNTCQP